jgi:hypothetical protein
MQDENTVAERCINGTNSSRVRHEYGFELETTGQLGHIETDMQQAVLNGNDDVNVIHSGPCTG